MTGNDMTIIKLDLKRSIRKNINHFAFHAIRELGRVRALAEEIKKRCLQALSGNAVL